MVLCRYATRYMSFACIHLVLVWLFVRPSVRVCACVYKCLVLMELYNLHFNKYLRITKCEWNQIDWKRMSSNNPGEFGMSTSKIGFPFKNTIWKSLFRVFNNVAIPHRNKSKGNTFLPWLLRVLFILFSLLIIFRSIFFSVSLLNIKSEQLVFWVFSSGNGMKDEKHVEASSQACLVYKGMQWIKLEKKLEHFPLIKHFLVIIQKMTFG